MWERGSVCVRVMDRCVLFVLLVGGVVASAGAESFYKGDACVGSVIPPGNIEAGLLAPGTYGALWDALHADAAWEAYGFTQTVMEGPGIPEKAWQAPNHANHLRCQFTAKEARLTPREGTPTRSWNLTLRTVAIEGYPAWDTTVNVVAERNRLIYRRGSGIEEWYLNDPRGLEQGFTLVRPPCTGDVVVIEMVVEGSLRPRWSRAGEEVAFVDESDHVLLRYGNLSVMDATGRLLPGRMELTERGIRLVARLADARYPVTIDPLLMSEQWAYTGDQNGAYVGRALARADVNGDGRVDLIVGAPYYDNGETDEGRVLVFYGTASGFPSVPNLTLEINVAYANFGTAVSSAGDVNGDGYDDVIVGASRYNNLQVQEGAAYLFLGSASGLSASPAWQVESNQAYALLGDAVAGAGDVNGDGYDDVLVGIPSYDDGSTQDVGRVQCYYGSASGLSTTPGWTVTGDRANARLGFAVSTAGDMNGDTYDDVVIGAPYYTGTATQEGRIYVYYGSASGLSSSSDTVEMYTAYANLGYSVAAAGDVNGDGKSDIVVGAPSSATGPMPKGYVFYGPITSNVRVDIVGEQANSRFGKSVAGAGDINGDGYDDVIISAPDFLVQNPNNSSMVGVGKVYAYRGSQHGIQATVPEWTLQGSLDGLGLGAKVSGVGDVNGDGYADVLVGDPTFDARTVSTNRGRVRLFLGAQSLVAVPDIREQAQGFAQTNLINAGLTVGTVLHQCDNAVLAGSVISQDPAPGTLVPLNTPVNITVSTGPCPQNVLVPDVTGLANFSAFSQIGQAGLIVGTVTQQCDNGVPAGYVISQDPVAGTSVAGGTPVNLVVSTGTCTVEVPYVVGLPQGDAESTLAALGLTPQVSQQCHGMIPAGTVISQDPEYGNTVYYGSSVNLVVSTGPCTALVPDVTGQPLATAQATIAGAGFQVGLLTYQCHATIPVNHVISQNPAGGSVVASGSAISLLVSSGPCSVTVPNLAGQTQASAQAEIVAAGLTVGTITTQCSNTVLAGRIISQNPPAGSLVATGSPVNLVVSTGPCTVTVPNVVGQAQATAQATLTAAGLVTGTITQQCHNTVPAGTVISQSPAGGTIVTPGAVVMLVVSSGPCVSVPNVVGQAQAAAQATLSAAGLATGSIVQQCDNAVPAGTVIGQSPAEGTPVSSGTAVDLVVSSGLCPGSVLVPDVTGQPQANAVNTVTSAGLAVGTMTSACDNTMPAGHVISQAPPAGQVVPGGEPVHLVISLGPCSVVVPDVTSQSLGDAQAAITGAGLTVGEITMQVTNLVPPGHVFSQAPSGGTSVAPGSTVDLVIAQADTQPPVITLSGEHPMLMACGSIYVEPGATATDNLDGDVSASIGISGAPPAGPLPPGTWVVSYTASDTAGNSASLSRTVTVQNDCPLTVTVTPLSLTVPVGGRANFVVTVSGAVGGVTYQWFRETGPGLWSLVPDASDAELVIEPVSEEDAGRYRCEVSDAVTTETTPVITLTVGASIPVATPIALVLAGLVLACLGARTSRSRVT